MIIWLPKGVKMLLKLLVCLAGEMDNIMPQQIVLAMLKIINTSSQIPGARGSRSTGCWLQPPAENVRDNAARRSLPAWVTLYGGVMGLDSLSGDWRPLAEVVHWWIVVFPAGLWGWHDDRWCFMPYKWPI